MVRALTKFHLDERWGGHMDIGYSGHIEIPLKKLMEYWTLELWIRLKQYPIVNETNVMISPTLLEIANTKVTYNDHEIQIKDMETEQAFHFKYPLDQWFQLVITNGKPDQLGYDSGMIYINGRELPGGSTMIFPPDIKGFTIGNKLNPGHRILTNIHYPSESSLGVVRIYNRILGKYEVYNNYLAQARQYALLMETEATPVKHSLVMELLAHQDYYDEKSAYWMTTREVLGKRAAQVQVPNKNPKKNYMNQVDELTRILQSLNRGQDSSSQNPNLKSAKKSDVDGDIIILSRNPEMFLKQLKKPDDKLTKKLLLQNQPKVQKDDYSGIFENPFKLKLLIVYLQNNPIHFMTLLKSDSLTSEQLVTLSNTLNSLRNSDTQVGLMQNPNEEGFWDGVATPQTHHDPVYQVALRLLESQVQQNAPSQSQSQPDTGPYAPYLKQLASRTGQIANIMNYNHQKQRVHLMDTIRQLNDNVSDVRLRLDKLEKLLAQQSAVLGLIISKQAGKCIGAIDRNGKIKHCSHRAAQSPYDIIVNKQVYSLNLNNMLQQHRLHGSSVSQILKQSKQLGMYVLGQCVNVYGKTIGLIVRQSDDNHYIPTQPAHPVSDIPILAILAPNKKENQGQVESETPKAPRASRSPKSPKKHKSDKCKPGYYVVENDAVWLSEEKHGLRDDEESKVRAIAEAQAQAKGEALARKVGIPSEEMDEEMLMRVKNASASPKAHHEEATRPGAPLSQEENAKFNHLFSAPREDEEDMDDGNENDHTRLFH